jgi:hypothetical protein
MPTRVYVRPRSCRPGRSFRVAPATAVRTGSGVLAHAARRVNVTPHHIRRRRVRSLQAPVDLTAVGDFHDEDHEPAVVNLVCHPVVADSEPVKVV